MYIYHLCFIGTEQEPSDLYVINSITDSELDANFRNHGNFLGETFQESGKVFEHNVINKSRLNVSTADNIQTIILYM